MSLSKSLHPLVDGAGKRIKGDDFVFSPPDRFNVVISPRGVFIRKLGGLAHILWHDSADVIELDPRTRHDSQLFHGPEADIHEFPGISAQTMTAIWRQVYWRVVNVPRSAAFLTNPRCVILLVVSWLWTTHLCKFCEHSQFPSNMPHMPVEVLRLLAPPTSGGVAPMVKWTRVYIDNEKTMRDMQMNLLPDKYEAFDLTQPMIDACAVHVDRMLAGVERSGCGNYELLTLQPLMLKEIARQLDVIRSHVVLPKHEVFDLNAIPSEPITDSESLDWIDLSNVDVVFDQLEQWTEELKGYEMLEIKDSCEAIEMPAMQQGAGDSHAVRDTSERAQVDQVAAGGDDALGRRSSIGDEKSTQRGLPFSDYVSSNGRPT